MPVLPRSLPHVDVGRTHPEAVSNGDEWTCLMPMRLERQ